ncbi:Ras-related and estrogen-regulated growth inhibitor [Temnothorax longispinosus]|uniref:small monomeric GTPase n=1 Tax=Temnothorax longispinosus TaxID=300112 RepID=A0A4S2JET9_9HYME|nr:Ras-related and estrogen-regulated growth inhibitor [Temnothorax longispinosus]
MHHNNHDTESETLTVRFLTRRYIGEYDHQSETRYKHEVLVDGEPILFEILDTCPKSENELPSMETLRADGLLLIYDYMINYYHNTIIDVESQIAMHSATLNTRYTLTLLRKYGRRQYGSAGSARSAGVSDGASGPSGGAWRWPVPEA